MIKIANLNPLRLRGQNDFLIQKNCYFQKWQSGDIVNVQFLTDEVFTIQVIDFCLGYPVLTVPTVEQATNLVDVDFYVREMSLNIDDLPSYGKYFFRITNSDGYVVDSHPFDYQERFDNTLLIYYRHSENDYNVIFETGIEYYIRVEGTIMNYSPKLDGDIYFDQKFDPTMINSQSYETYLLQIGQNRGVATWIADIINAAFSCDNKKINNIFIERNEGADWEVIRVDNYTLIGMTLEILRSRDDADMSTIKTISVLATDESVLISNNDNKIYLDK